jgi:acetyl-CoA/propionyl-CoA carboxylase biotin carboxyl carrier protein
MVVEGMATALPFHRLVVRDPSFVDEPFRIHTRWIETEWDNCVPAFAGAASLDPAHERSTVVVEIAGKRIEVTIPVGLGSRAAAQRPRKPATRGQVTAATGNALASPMQGTIVKVAVTNGDTVAEGDLVVVLEAMKMEQPINAHKAGVIGDLTAEVGATVSAGAALCTIT